MNRSLQRRIRAGFELEFGCEKLPKDILRYLKILFGEDYPITNRIRQYANEHSDCAVSRYKDSIVLKGDASIYFHMAAYLQGFEITTPAIPLIDSLPLLDRLFTALNLIEAETNSTCGFHVNLSFVNEKRNHEIDPIFLLMLIDERSILKEFKRLSNEYCESYLGKVKRWATSGIDWDMLIDKCMRSSENYRATNFSHLKERGYVEFRSIGGSGYLEKFQRISQIIEHMAQCLDYSTDLRKQKTVTRRLNTLCR